MIEFLRSVLGIDADTLNPGQMAMRAVLTFVVAVVIVRLGHKRLFGKGTASDLVVAIMIGSVLSRAITNTSDADLSRVRLSYLERDGTISVIPRHEGPRILEVRVDRGVQVVRIAVE